jgi:hypothetical protein
MKTFAIAFAALTVAALGAPALVPVAVTARNVKIEKISHEAVGTPEFTITNTKPKRSTLQKWLEIEVEFAIEGVEMVDELSFKFDVLLGGKLYTGDIAHVNIPKGRERYTVMYISPRNLDRITGGKPFNPAMIDNIWVTISKQGQALAISSIKDKTGRLPVPNAQQFQGLLTPKSETPFSVLWTDRYEAVKLPTR